MLCFFSGLFGKFVLPWNIKELYSIAYYCSYQGSKLSMAQWSSDVLNGYQIFGGGGPAGNQKGFVLIFNILDEIRIVEDKLYLTFFRNVLEE